MLDKGNDPNDTRVHSTNASLVEALITLKPFLSRVEENSIAISAIDNRLSLLAEEVRKLARIMYEGNGQPPLTTRLATMETHITQVRSDLGEVRADSKTESDRIQEHIQEVDKAYAALSIKVDDYKEIEREDKKNKAAKSLFLHQWRLTTAQAVGLFFLTSTLTWLGGHLLEHFNLKPTGRTTPQVISPSK